MKGKFSSYTTIRGIAYIAYLVITAILILFHEYWRDESQAWLIARDLSFLDIIKQMQYEGHPCLWHMILAPFAKLGFPFYTISVINWGMMAITMWLVLYRTKIKEELKILLLFTAPMIGYYPVIARCYSLMCLLMVLIAIVYKKRREKPILLGMLLFLLTNTHVIVAAFTGMIGLTFYGKEIVIHKNKDKKMWMGCFIAIAGFIILFLQIYQSIFLCEARRAIVNEANLPLLLNSVLKAIGFFLQIFDLTANHAIITYCLEIVIALGMILLCMLLPRDSKQEFVIISISFLFIFLVSIFIYCNSWHRSNILYLLLIFYLIHYNGKRKETLEGIVRILCVLSILMGMEYVAFEIRSEYSSSKNMASYIVKNCSDDAIFVSDTPDINLAIITYLDDWKKDNQYQFYNLQTDQYYTFITWNYEMRAPIKEEAFFEKIEKLKKSKNVYFLHTESKGSIRQKDQQIAIIEQMEQGGKITKMYEKSGCFTDERFSLYQIEGITYGK